MTHHQKITLAALAIWAIGFSSGLAQPPAPPADAAAPAEATEEAESPVRETNPAVLAALALPRQQAADYFEAVTLLITLDRPELAKPILDELTRIQLNDSQRAELVERFGSSSMLRLARTKELAPAGAEFADACTAAANAAAQDGRRIATLLAQLSDPSAEVRTLARNDLAATGRVGVIATLEALAKEPNRDRRTALLTAAAQMDPLVRGPLLAMLDNENPVLRADVIALLQHLEVLQAAPLLQASSASAEPALSAAIEEYRQGALPFAPNERNEVELWRLCGNKLLSTRVPLDDARIIWMSKLAQQRAQIQPQNRDYLRDALLLSLESKTLLHLAFEAVGQPACAPTTSASFFQKLDSADLRLLNELLTDALDAKYSNAAIDITTEIGRRRDAQVLYTADSQPSPLAAALHYPDRRVRFAALEAIMAIDPNSPYPGSSRVPDALAWFARAEGERLALVAMPSLAAATSLAGILNGRNMYAEATSNGLEAVKLARQTPDLEMIFVDLNIDGRGIRDALYELRLHPTTGQIPIALLAPDGKLTAAERLAAEHTRIIAVPRPHSTEVVTRLVEQLTQMASRDTTAPQQRVAEAEQARRWLDQLAVTRRFYTIRRTAMLNPAPAPRPVEALPSPPAS